jgi:DNA-binding LacI/PurR family transcriptional regulator
MPIDNPSPGWSSESLSNGSGLRQSKPLYLKITETLRSRILRGEWAEGDAIPTRRALAAELKTTHATIDKAISELIREGIVSATVGSGTYVKRKGAPPAARAATNASQRIGVILGHSTFTIDPTASAKRGNYYVDVLSGIQDTVFGQHIDVAYVNVYDGPYDVIAGREFDGIIVIAPVLADLANLKSLSKTQRMIAIGISADESPDDLQLPAVDSDNRNATYQAVRHLIDLGHRQIGMINLSLQLANLYDRYRGYIDALSEARLSICPDHLLFYPNFGTASGEKQTFEWMQRLVEQDRLPTAVFSSDQVMTTDLVRALRRLSIRIPEDMSVIGFDDLPALEYGSPAISVVRQPTYDLGKTAARRLLESLAHPDAPFPEGTIRLPCEFVQRESISAPRQPTSK